MKFKLLSVALLAATSIAFAQQREAFWKLSTRKNLAPLESRMQLPTNYVYDLDVPAIVNTLADSPLRSANAKSSMIIISLPNAEGQMERFSMYENPTMDPALQQRYPEIRSYVGYGIDHPTSTVYLSTSPLGFKSMTLNADKPAVFIEPISQDLSQYTVYRKSDKRADMTPFECSVLDVLAPQPEASALRPNADDAVMRTFRLAMSCTGEYTAYFGGTKALALAAINASITRCNGVFEKDFGARLIIIANTDAVIYTNASTDPYSAASSMSQWNGQLQSTLTSVIGEANYDIGHLFGATGGGGNAGCIGCICVNGQKGSGITSPNNGIPYGDSFDIDYVAHEIGHQMGANHTWTHGGNEGTGAQMEPGSGSTIMGYAGITSLDVQPHSDAYFHAISIQQVTNNIKAKTCSVNTATGNAVPTASAGADFTIPKSTPFMLTAVGTDANGDALTYNWEQMDNQTTTAVPSATKTTGVNFRSYDSSTSPTRYFPRMASVLAGATTTAGTELTVEALSSVARTLNFRVTVRDNRAGGPANNSDDMVVTVNATAGPFTVSAPNTAVSYVGGSAQTVTWNVAGTTANGVNCANVDILLSTDAGNTWSTLLAATPNDGSQSVTIPNTPGATNRIMVKGTNHIFFDVSNTNFTITAGSTDTEAPTAPALTASNTTETATDLSWSGATDNVGVTGYDVYQNGAFRASTTSTSFAATGLTPSTSYDFTVRAKDAAGNISGDSNTVNVVTLTPVPDTTAPTAPTLSASGTTTTATNLSWSGATDNIAVTAYDVYQNGVFRASTASTSYAATGLTSATAYTFYVIANDAAGNQSPQSNTVNVTTLTVVLNYCTSQGNSTVDERIGRVQFGTINNISTGTAGYENFTAITTNIVRGSANTITITPTWTGSSMNEGYAVFIDYNRDGDFSDSGETVLTKAKSKTTPVTGSITIPASATLGATRMRVSMKYNATPTACEVFAFGQVEDYTINITATARPGEGSTELIAFALYPNPVKGAILNINVDGPANYRIFNMMGQELGRGSIENQMIPVGALASGTYLVEVSNATGSTSRRFIKQ